MEGKINKEGVLEMKRAGKFKEMQCRLAGELISCVCGDDCPHFREPVILRYKLPNITELQICQGNILAFHQFTDER